LLDEIAIDEQAPDAVAVARETRETIELAYLAALQVLPPRSRPRTSGSPCRTHVLRRARRDHPLLERAFGKDRDGDWRLLPTMANRMPTAASYLRRPGDTAYRAFKLDVLRAANGLIVEITTFGAELFPAFGLPAAA
jgi:hypothetical protein